MTIGVSIGSGNRPIQGFLNFDITTSENVSYGLADNLPMIDNHSVDILFSNAVFEHLDPKKYKDFFSEWKRILKNTGHIVFLGIPDFHLICRLYLQGVFSEDQVYNYAIGEINESQTIQVFQAQIHKRLFTKQIIKNIFNEYNMNSTVFNYCYPNEIYPVNIGILSSLTSLDNINDTLKKIPYIENYIEIKTIQG